MIANAKRTNASDEYVAVTRIPIADQITRELLQTTGRRQLVRLTSGLPKLCWSQPNQKRKTVKATRKRMEEAPTNPSSGLDAYGSADNRTASI